MADQIADGAAVTAAEIESTPSVAAAASPSAGVDDTTHKRRADDNDAASPRKKARNDPTEAEASDGVEEGEINSDAESKASASSKQARQTWNNGVTTQLRTSFGSSSKSSKLSAAKPPAKIIAASAELPPSPPEQLAPEIRGELVAAVTEGETTNLQPVKEHGRIWELPTFKADFKGETWDEVSKSMFFQWSTDFISKNQGNVDEVGLDHKFLGKVYLQTLETSLPDVNPTLISVSNDHLRRTSKRSLLKKVAKGWTDSLKEGKRGKREAKDQAEVKIEQENKQPPEQPKQPPTRQTRSSAKMAETRDSDTGKPANSSDRKSSAASSSGSSLPGLPPPPPSELAASHQSPTVAEEDVPLDEDDGDDGNDNNWKPSNMVLETKAESEALPSPTEDELEQRHRYFPGVPDDAVFCITCATHGHNTTGCPETTCKFCQQGHFSYSCPSRQRCAKCKQLGHTKVSCKEKLAMAAGEGFMECAFCQAQDHQEEKCPEIWETYRPQVGHIKQVRSVPMFCYCCGAEGHFGTDCGLADPKLPPSATWSNAGASLYVDPTSSEEAIASKNPMPEAQAILAPVIPGRSIKPQSHIIFEDSGDEDIAGQGFVRAPAAGPRRPGQIQITSNINFGSSAGPSTQNGRGAQQDSTNSRQRRNQRGPNVPASLPPKPRAARSPAPAPQASRKGKKNNKKGGKNPPQQQPPLPPGPPPSSNGWRPPEFQTRGANSARGRGGFSSLSRGGGGRRGGGRN